MLIQLLMPLTLIANLSGAQRARKVLVNITMTSCGGQRNNVCVTAYTTADNETDARKQGDGFVQFDWVRYSGPTSNQYPACSVVFTDDQNVYPLSPHFGPFPECSNVLSAYRHQLADTLDKANSSIMTFQPLRQNGCPIQSLPLNYDEYIACINTKFDTWYLFRFSTFLTEDQNETSEVWYLAYAPSDGSLSPAMDQHIRPLITLTAKCKVQALFPLKYPTVPFIVDLQVQISMQASWNNTSANDSQLPAMVATRSKRLSALDPWLLIEFPLNRNRQKLRICYRYHTIVTSAKFNTTVVPVNMKHSRCLDTYVEDCAAKSGTTNPLAYSIISVNALLYTILIYFLRTIA
ncbi:hypothetical protein M513_01773 [Trichuris suis]|uniref:Uncharacterized protein n=2 Tax=Trichuris suis TaxID=68888 RepID=A0A085MJ66_9BILA|nr:hypothetical protein M513_01773 [Trichuris suis]